MRLINSDSLEALKELKDNSIHAVVTDPPYGLSFMGQKWDYDVPSVELWRHVLRVLKPGGHLLSFGGTRTYHRMVVNIEDAGFEIRDQLQWLYGSGFPKSHNIRKALDKKNADSEKWDGFGTGLKPANEPIVLARKPFKGTVADNVLNHGCGGLNIDGCRVEIDPSDPNSRPNGSTPLSEGGKTSMFKQGGRNYEECDGNSLNMKKGRFPANLILDETAAEMLDEQSGILKNGGQNKTSKSKGFNKTGYISNGKGWGDQSKIKSTNYAGDSGGASRFFYVAKASKKERGEGNNHPTVKPVKLMRYLVRLITPPGGAVLDPFMGSGTTGVAAIKEDFNFVGIERKSEYVDIARNRIDSKR